MTTFKRICIKTTEFRDAERTMTLERGREYLTSAEKDGNVCVFSQYWAWVPLELFAGAEQFTGPGNIHNGDT